MYSCCRLLDKQMSANLNHPRPEADADEHKAKKQKCDDAPNHSTPVSSPVKRVHSRSRRCCFLCQLLISLRCCGRFQRGSCWPAATCCRGSATRARFVQRTWTWCNGNESSLERGVFRLYSRFQCEFEINFRIC